MGLLSELERIEIKDSLLLTCPEVQKSEEKKDAFARKTVVLKAAAEKITATQAFNISVVVSGNVVQVRKYERFQFLYRKIACGKESIPCGVRDGEWCDEGVDHIKKEKDVAEVDSGGSPMGNGKSEASEKSARRAKDKVARIINSNFGGIKGGWQKGQTVKFITLTYAENMEVRHRAYWDWVRFVDGLEYRLRGKIQYVAVPEQQKRGAWHIHALLYCKYIPFAYCEHLWNKERGLGCFKLERARYPDNAGAYIAKYISKEFDPGEGRGGSGRKKGEHRYWKSNGLKDLSFIVKADSRNSELDLEGVVSMCLPYSVRDRSGEYDGEYTGKVRFYEFTLVSQAWKYGICQAIGDMSRGEFYGKA